MYTTQKKSNNKSMTSLLLILSEHLLRVEGHGAVPGGQVEHPGHGLPVVLPLQHPGILPPRGLVEVHGVAGAEQPPPLLLLALVVQDLRVEPAHGVERGRWQHGDPAAPLRGEDLGAEVHLAVGVEAAVAEQHGVEQDGARASPAAVEKSDRKYKKNVNIGLTIFQTGIVCLEPWRR